MPVSVGRPPTDDKVIVWEEDLVSDGVEAEGGAAVSAVDVSSLMVVLVWFGMMLCGCCCVVFRGGCVW